MVTQGLNFSPFFIALKCLIFDKRKAINYMNIFQKDEIGLPSTLVAIMANVFQVIDLMNINLFLTVIISIMSIIWLVFKIKNEKAALEARKKDEKGK